MQLPATAILLFSGGLDSLLSARLLEAQNIKVKCLHFTSPFFGNANKIEHWKKVYNLDIQEIDLSQRFIEILIRHPRHGFGKHLNPCIDCKILFLQSAKELLPLLGAQFIATGEVIGQRPMSQGKNTLQHIQKNSMTTELVLRPLSARLLPATSPERQGFINREMLEAISGRNRRKQLQLAEEFNLQEIPAPAGGCLLTEEENCRRYWQILKNASDHSDMEQLIHDFKLVPIGRQFFNGGFQLSIGRNSKDNLILENIANKNDIIFKLINIPGPLAIASNGVTWPRHLLREAAEMTASYSPRAMQKKEADIKLFKKDGEYSILTVNPNRRENSWFVPGWKETRQEIRNLDH